MNTYYMLTEAYVSNLMNDSITDKIRSLRHEALRKLSGVISFYEKEGFIDALIEKICKQKIQYILSANSKTEIEQILKISAPRYNGVEFYPRSKYHLEEEEMIWWSITSLKGPLISEAAKRYIQLFEKFCQEGKI